MSISYQMALTDGQYPWSTHGSGLGILKTFSTKGQVRNILGFGDHMVSATTTQLY